MSLVLDTISSAHTKHDATSELEITLNRLHPTRCELCKETTRKMKLGKQLWQRSDIYVSVKAGLGSVIQLSL